MPQPEYWVNAQIERMLDTHSELRKAAAVLEEAEKYFWGRIANQVVSTRKVDDYSVQLLFYISSVMFGERLWKSVVILMDAVAKTLGYTNPFNSDSLRE